MSDRQLFERIGAFLDRHGPFIAGLLSAVGLVFFGDFVHWTLDPEAPIYVSVSGLVLGTVTLAAVVYTLLEGSDRTTESIRLSAENDGLRELLDSLGTDYSALWDNRLQMIAETLHMDGGDRISVYRFDDDKFLMVGRYSIQPQLQLKGRAVYPINQGVIGRAWSSPGGECCVEDLPDPGDLPTYRQRNSQEWGIPGPVITKMRMKARSIYAYVLVHPATKVRNGVIVFESTAPARFGRDVLGTLVTGPAGKDIEHQLELITKHGPSLELARQKGF